LLSADSEEITSLVAREKSRGRLFEKGVSMAVESFDASDFGSVEDLKGSQFLEVKGQYHLVIVEVDESRSTGNGIKIKFGVLAGTAPGQQNKSFRDMFWDPRADSKDGGKFAKARRLSLLLATGYITEDQIGKSFTVDWQAILERQLKAAVDVKESASTTDSTKTYLNAGIKGTDMWGPLDDAAQHIPHDDACIEAAVRAGQANVVSKYKGAAVSNAPATTTKPATTTAAPVAGADKYAGL